MSKLPTLALAALLLAGCSGIRTLAIDVSSFGDWPADRQAGTYAFDRLPSQQAQLADTEQLEAAARPALDKAGFKPAAEGQPPDVLVQVGSRAARTDRVLWDDPIWWRGGFGYWRHGPWPGPAWGASGYWARIDGPRYDREVAVLLRDRASGKPLFESHAAYESASPGDKRVVQALFEAALTDFPKQGANPRQVVITLAPQ
jgi:hypothetical protein